MMDVLARMLGKRPPGESTAPSAPSFLSNQWNLDSPLVYLSQADPWTIRDACAGSVAHRWEPSTAFKSFFLAFLAMCFRPWIVMAIRRSRGVRSHGDSIGDSRLESVLPIRHFPPWIQLVIDPALAFTAGAATHSADTRLSFLLKASAVAMLCIRGFAYSHYRAGIREAVEHQLESAELVQDIAPELQPPLPPPRTHPTAAPAEVFISPNVAAGRPETAGLFERPHPKYRELLEENQEPPARQYNWSALKPRIAGPWRDSSICTGSLG